MGFPTKLQINGTAASGAAIQVRFEKVSATADYTPNKEKWSAIISLENQSSSLVEMQADLLMKPKTIASASLNIDVSQLEIGRDGSEMVVIQKVTCYGVLPIEPMAVEYVISIL